MKIVYKDGDPEGIDDIQGTPNGGWVHIEMMDKHDAYMSLGGDQHFWISGEPGGLRISKIEHRRPKTPNHRRRKGEKR